MKKMERVRSQLRQRGISQREAARALQVSEFRLSRVLGGRFRARATERRKLADLLGLPLGELFPRRKRRKRSV